MKSEKHRYAFVFYLNWYNLQIFSYYIFILLTNIFVGFSLLSTLSKYLKKKQLVRI